MSSSSDSDSNSDTFQTSLNSQKIAAVIRDDAEELKNLLNSSKSYEISHPEGYNLLELSIIENSKAVFDFLISLEEYIDCNNPKKTRKIVKSALKFALPEENEYYTLELIKRDSNIHTDYLEGNPLLHWVVTRNFIKTAQILIENGANVNLQNREGFTPLFMCLSSYNPGIINEGVSLLLYYGANPFAVYSLTGKNVFESALDLYHVDGIELAQEILFFHVVDEYYEPSLEFLCDLIDNKSPFFFKIANCVTKCLVEVDEIALNENYYINLLFSMGLEYLLVFLKKFDYVVKAILQNSSRTLRNYSFKSTSIENFNVLLESHLVFETIQFIGNISIRRLIQQLLSHIPSENIIELINFLLTYGVNVYDEDLEIIYELFGHCDLFKTLLHMNIKMTDFKRDIMSALIYDVTTDIQEFLESPEKYNFSQTTLLQLSHHFAHSKLKSLCFDFDLETDTPQVPLLVELARNVARKFLVETFQVGTFQQFFALLKWLPVNIYCKKILLFETKLY